MPETRTVKTFDMPDVVEGPWAKSLTISWSLDAESDPKSMYDTTIESYTKPVVTDETPEDMKEKVNNLTDEAFEEKRKKWVEEDAERLKTFGVKWHYLCCKVRLAYVVEHTLEYIDSIGICRVESDADDEHIAQIEDEEISNVLDIVKVLRITMLEAAD